ncbi:hypothetical protein [Streptomyces sp. MAR4 CNX-425]|uniref:hypothetical protein n=1 Tax=Streptomyces sp. MAR4 CNX-425 TaxID=3406343 RepID=UPI003B503E16
MAGLMWGVGPVDVFVDTATVDVVGESLVVEFEPRFTDNGLVEADPAGDGLRILCGQEIGTVGVGAELWDGAPPLEAAAWQDVAEVSVAWESAFMDFATNWQESDDEAGRLPLRSGAAAGAGGGAGAAGPYRVRVHGRNRDGADPRGDGEPREEYLLQVWRAAPAAPALLKSTSATGASARRG